MDLIAERTDQGSPPSVTRAGASAVMIDLESIPDAVVIVDQHERITHVNAHTEALLGYAQSELDGQSIEIIVPERVRQQHSMHRRDHLAAPRFGAMGAGKDLRARHKNGQDIPVEIMLSPGAAETVVAVIRDISVRRDLERFRDEYLGCISHDLKNPLSIISLHARLLSRRLLERKLEEEYRAADIIAQSADFIDKLVRDLLEMSYLEVQQVPVQKERTELVPFLESVIARTVSTSDRWRVRLEVRGSATAALDGTRIERVLVNFVQNALKYSSPDSPIVVQLETRGDVAVVSVIDEGPGLSSEEAAFVFDKYRRTLTAGKREGLGLGLYICQKIVEAHAGRIGVNSTLGQGSTFYFELPLNAGESARFAATVAPPGPLPDFLQRLRGAHVLIVDDERNAVSALGELLRDEGINVMTATSGPDALEQADVRRPDAVVLDVEMPGMGGLVLLKRLRQRMPGIPAVIMTGHMAHHTGISEARAAYMSKPVNVDELLQILGRLVVQGAAPFEPPSDGARHGLPHDR